VLLSFLTAVLCAIASPGIAVISPANPVSQTGVDRPVVTQGLVNQGRTLYETGQFAAAAQVLERAVQQYRGQGDSLGESIALSNLSLVYQQLGRWDEAAEAITTSLEQLQASTSPERSSLLAQALDIQGRLQLTRGQGEAALETWEQAAVLYEELGNESAVIRSGINQAEALQSLGLYRRAILTLDRLTQSLQDQPDSLESVSALRSLGEALRVAGHLPRSQQILQQSLAMAQRLQIPEAIAAVQFSLGNTLQSLGDTPAALNAYQQAVSSGSPTTRTQALLNRFRLLVETGQRSQAQALIPQISAQLDRLPPGRAKVYARINFAKSLMTMGSEGTPTPEEIGQMLASARQDAQALSDPRAESFAVGNLGELYERANQWSDAQRLTEQALVLSQQINAADMMYLWQWQLGRILKAQSDREGAIAAYSDAITTLQSLRSDLVAISTEVQFSFRDSIEPIHRELVSLLLKPGTEPTQADLEQARKTIESLQLAELDNFFREACLNAREIQIDEVDRRAAVIYPIILPDRLEVILSLPQPLEGNQPMAAASQATQQSTTAVPPQSLRHYTTNLPQNQVESTVGQLLATLRQLTANQRAMPLSQQVYDWLIRPAEVDLQASGVKTLVFVLDGVLRNIPMAVLHDGQQYLLEKYSVALTPSLQLLESQPLQSQQLSVLLGGVSEARQNFPPLPGVITEVEEIQSEIPSSITLLNQEFTDTTLQAAINRVPFPVIHLATHGQFSSKLEDTFILTWNGRIDINQLNSLLQASDLSRRHPIELLVLSACTTAVGDNRAALGLAGMAVRAGARSTVATLWQLSDEAAPILMERFYQELSNPSVTKAEALRRAQLSLLQESQFRRPYFWSPIVLVGNWL
jgi:CHAT domain-containing protein/predicted negative regulator of RcsB-dependent stress response